MCAAPLRSDRRTVGPWSSPWPSVQLVHESKDEEMVRWLVTYLALVDPWSPDRVGAFRDTFVVLALPCCIETEPDLEDFLALVPSNGLGCGYVGLIVPSWSTLTRENCAAAAGARAGREGHWEARWRPNGGGCVCWPGRGAGRLSDWLRRLRGVWAVRTCRRTPHLPMLVLLIGVRPDESRLSFLSSRVCLGGPRLLLQGALAW